MKRILFVDDEPQVLKSLLRLFMDEGYELSIAQSGEQALELLSQKEFDLVMSDMRMPNMDGYELLTHIKKRYPKILRIILSGYCEERVVFKALQDNIAKFYLFKPWENEVLLNVVKRVFQTQDSLKENNLMQYMNNMNQLPTIKDSYQRILQLIEEDMDFATISEAISKDQSIATKILHVVNSAFFGVKTGSINQAITFIGLKNVRNIVISSSLLDLFTGNKKIGREIQEIWRHAFVTNKLLSFFYQKCLGKNLPDSASTAGLLHNIGIVFLLDYHKEKYVDIIHQASINKESLMQMEKHSLQMTHMQAGGYLLDWWEFPYAIIEAAIYHHQPMNENVLNRELVCAVHLAAHYASSMLKINYFEVLDEQVFEVLGTKKEDFEDCILNFEI